MFVSCGAVGHQVPDGTVLLLLVPPGDHRLTVASGAAQDWQGLPDLFGTPAFALPQPLRFRIDGTRREIIFNASGREVLWRTVVVAIGCILIIPIPWVLGWIAR